MGRPKIKRILAPVRLSHRLQAASSKVKCLSLRSLMDLSLFWGANIHELCSMIFGRTHAVEHLEQHHQNSRVWCLYYRSYSNNFKGFKVVNPHENHIALNSPIISALPGVFLS